MRIYKYKEIESSLYIFSNLKSVLMNKKNIGLSDNRNISLLLYQLKQLYLPMNHGKILQRFKLNFAQIRLLKSNVGLQHCAS